MPEELHDEMPALAPPLSNAASRVGQPAATKPILSRHAGGQSDTGRASGNDCSTDKGYCQLLSPTLRIRDYFRNVGWMRHLSIKNLAFNRSSARLLGTCGDQQFKGTGCCGIGPKSATQLLVEFQSLEGIYGIWMRLPKSGAKN